jgi:hypothetical protein
LTPLAETLVETEVEQACLDALRGAAGEADGPMERHCARCFLFAEALADKHDATFDREVLLCASLLHDVGLYESVSDGGVYTEEGGELMRKMAEQAGWDAARTRTADDACAHHHALSSQWELGPEVELLRLADRIEVSGGLIRSGLSRSEVHDVFERAPRSGFYTGVAQLLGKAIVQRPTTLPKIFR